MAEWVYFIHAPREDFAATMTEHEKAVFAEHWERLKRLYAEGTVILAGPTLGRTNTPGSPSSRRRTSRPRTG